MNGNDVELWQLDRQVANFERNTDGPMKRVPPSTDAIDLDARASEALEAARLMPPGKEKSEALKKAGMLRNAADIRGLFFAKRGRPPK